MLSNLNYGVCFQLKAHIYFECQVGITRQKTEGARHILPPSVSDPPRLPEIDASEHNLTLKSNSNKKT